MNNKIVFFTSIFFAIGFLMISIMSLFKKAPKNIWLKYFIYLALVALWLGWMQFFFTKYYILISIISIIGWIEMVFVGKRSDAPESFQFFSMISFLFMAAFSVAFSLRASYTQALQIFMLTFCFDGFSQLSGNLLGKTKITPTLSPNKTLEGLLGGLIITLIALAWIFPTPTDAAYKVWILRFFTCIFALTGDLMASYFKRKNKVKDFSKLIPGHGGILDRFDSLIATQAFSYLWYF